MIWTDDNVQRKTVLAIKDDDSKGLNKYFVRRTLTKRNIRSSREPQSPATS